ncbi:Protein-disulfide isomerase DsbC/DsbG [Vibrio furnissii NCTC 11218]|nr:Protein-disulfide isomerase DsbC/DsbG [Vibrio furnissii NCTC 11218]
MVNTFDAHCLVAYAKTQGVENTVSDRLMEAAFVKGWNIADIDRLIAIAVDAGLDEQPVKSILLNKQFKNSVADDISNGQRMGVKSVPYYRINNRYEISGANSKEQFKHYIQSVLDKEKLDNMPSARSCGDAGCIISE